MAEKKTKITENIAKKSLLKKSEIPGSIFLELKNPKALSKLVIKKDSGGEMLKGNQKKLDKNKDGKISGEDFKMMKAKSGKMMKAYKGDMAKGYGAARTQGQGLQDENLIPGKSLDYYKDIM